MKLLKRQKKDIWEIDDAVKRAKLEFEEETTEKLEEKQFSVEIEEWHELLISALVKKDSLRVVQRKKIEEGVEDNFGIEEGYQKEYDEALARLSQLNEAITEERNRFSSESIGETNEEWEEKKEEFKDKLLKICKNKQDIEWNIENFLSRYADKNGDAIEIRYLEELKDGVDDEVRILNSRLREGKERFETTDNEWDKPYRKEDFSMIVLYSNIIFGNERASEYARLALEKGGGDSKEMKELLKESLEKVSHYKEKLSELKGEEYYFQKKSKQIEEALEKYKINYKPFNPEEELKKVTRLSSEDIVEMNQKQITALKRKRLENYKKELATQKEGITQMQLDLEREVNENSDFTLRDLMDLVYERAEELRLTEKQLKEFESVLRDVVNRRDLVSEVREMFPNDDDLCAVCFGGVKPLGYVEVEKHSTYLYFRCFNPKDFENFTKKQEGKFISGAIIKISPLVRGSLLVENALISDNSEITRLHEEQHHIYDITNPEKFVENEKIEVTRYVNRLKDEFLAFYKAGEDPSEIYKILDGYNFLEECVKQEDPKVFKDMLKIFFDGLKRATKAIGILESSGKSREEIVALLGNENFNNWFEVAKRMSGNNKNK